MADPDYDLRVGARVRKARKDAKLTAKQVAKRLGVSESTLRAWENGQNGLHAKTAVELSPIIKSPATWLLFGEGDAGLEDAAAIRAAGLLRGQPDDEQDRIVEALELLVRRKSA